MGGEFNLGEDEEEEGEFEGLKFLLIDILGGWSGVSLDWVMMFVRVISRD